LPRDECGSGERGSGDTRLAAKVVQAGVLGHREVEWPQRLIHPKMKKRLRMLQRVPDLRRRIDHVSILTYSFM
jgi:hypothetical protein